MDVVLPGSGRGLRSAGAGLGTPRDRLAAEAAEPPRHSSVLGFGFKVAAEPLWLPPATTEDLKALSEREGVPLSATLLAVFQTLLYRETGREDISVGVVLSGEKASGGFPALPMVPCAARAEFADDPPFRDLLRRTRIEWSTTAFPLVPAAAAPANTDKTGDLSRLVSVYFGFGGGSPSEWPAEQYDLAISLFEEEGGLRGALLYDGEILEVSAIERLRGHFLTLLEGVAAEPDWRVGRLPFLTPAERHRILVEWNDTQADFPRDPLPRLFETQAERTPDAVAVRDGQEEIRFGELNRRANRLAHFLRKRGVGPEVVVGVCIERSAHMLVSLLGVLKAGGAYVPLDPSYPEERVAFMLRDSGARVLLTEERWAPGLSGHEAAVVCLDAIGADLSAEPETSPASGAGPENLAYVIYTSGSTGRPKGVEALHRGCVNRFAWMWRTYPFAAGEVCCQKTALSFADSVWEIFGPLLQGVASVVLTEEEVRDPRALVESLATAGVTRIVLVPSLLRTLLDSGVDLAAKLPMLKWWVSSGEALSLGLYRRFQRALPDAVLINLYGSSEVSADVTCYDSRWGEPRDSVPIGRPISNTQVYILDERRQPVPVDVPGELYIGGEGLARGYRNRPELTAERFLPDPFGKRSGARLFKTGDRARYLADGEIEFLGRLDHQVKIRGYRIELGEIESVLARHPAIRECVAIALPDGSGEKQLVAYMVARDKMPTVAELRAFVKGTLPDYMVPSAFVSLDSLPLTPSGKVDRRALPAPGTERPELEKPFVAPRDSWELRLARIWEQAFRLESVGVRDDFFELGGHSLLAGRLFAEIQKSFGKNLLPTALLRAPTIEQLAVLLRGEQEVPRWTSLVPIQTGGSRPPLFCMHAGGGTVLYYHDLARGLGPDQPVYGLQPQGLYGGMPPHAEVEEMAAHYISEIRTVQPQGPYFLAGFCFGGVLAFAMTQQLRREGAEVALLASFDGGSPSFDYALRTGSDTNGDATEEAGKARSWITYHRSRLGRLALREKIWYLAKRGRNRFRIWRNRLRARVHLGIGDLFRLLERPLPEGVRHTYFRANSVRASLRYAPPSYPGRMFLFERMGAFRDRHLGWDGLVTGGLEIREIPARVASAQEYHRFFIPALAGRLKEVLHAVASGRNEPVLSRGPR